MSQTRALRAQPAEMPLAHARASSVLRPEPGRAAGDTSTTAAGGDGQQAVPLAVPLAAQVPAWGSHPTPLLPRWFREQCALMPVPAAVTARNSGVRVVGQLGGFWVGAAGERTVPAATLRSLVACVAPYLPRPGHVVLPSGTAPAALGGLPLRPKTLHRVRALPEALGPVTVLDLLRYRGFGVGSLLDLMCVLEVAGEVARHGPAAGGREAGLWFGAGLRGGTEAASAARAAGWLTVWAQDLDLDALGLLAVVASGAPLADAHLQDEAAAILDAASAVAGSDADAAAAALRARLGPAPAVSALDASLAAVLPEMSAAAPPPVRAAAECTRRMIRGPQRLQPLRAGGAAGRFGGPGGRSGCGGGGAG